MSRFPSETGYLDKGLARVSQGSAVPQEFRCTELESLMRATRPSVITAAVALVLVAACGATEQFDGQSMAQGTAPGVARGTEHGTTPGIARITAVIEKAGFICDVQERHPDKFVQVVDCGSSQDGYRKLIASEWKDTAARDEMYRNRMPGMCGTLGLKDQVRWSTSGNWALVAGGGAEMAVDALHQATDALGFELHAVPCQ